MKNIFKKILSSGLAICFLATVCVCPTLAANEDIAEKTLKYFDEAIWSDFSHAGGTTQVFKLPDGIDSMSGGNNDSLDNGTQVSGVFGKASEDLSVKLAAKAIKSSNRNIYLHLSKSGDTSVNAANLTAGDKYTLYIDMAAASVGNAASHGIRIRGRQTTSAAAGTEHFPVIFKTVNGNPVIQVYNDDETNSNVKNIPYTLSTWVNIAIETEVVSEGLVTFKTYVNGELVATSVKKNLAGITYVDAGLQWNTSTHSQKPDLYFDNVAFYKSGFSADRYKAIEAASAISVADIKGSNTSLDSLTGNLNLITTGSNGTAISWESSHPQLVSTGGVMTPSGTEATKVTLTATVTSGEISEKKIYKVTVPYDENGYVNPDLNAVNADMAALNEDVIKAGNASLDAVTANLYLPTSGTNGSSITWESSAESVISTGGIVKASYIRERTVTLTATITKNDISLSKSFTVTVPIRQTEGDSEEDSSFFKDDFRNYTYKFEEALSSPLQPFTVMHSKGVYRIYNNKLYSDRSGLGTSTATDKPYIIYKMDEVIEGFVVDTLFYRDGEEYCKDFEFSVSADGEVWRNLTDSVSISDKDSAYNAATGYAECRYSAQLEEYSNYYLKISWGSAGNVKKRYRAGIDTVSITYPDEVQLASRDFTFDRVSTEEIDEVTKNLDLKLSGDYGTSISWTSSNEEVISSETGAVNSDAFSGYSEDVILTATFSKAGLESRSKEFTVTVNKVVSSWSDMDFVNFDLEGLTFESFCDQPQSQVVGKVRLPEGVDGGSSFTWSVSDTTGAAVLDETGYVVNFIANDYKITDLDLIVTATKGSASKSKTFPVSIIRGYGKNLITASGLSASSGSDSIRNTQERALNSYWQSADGDTQKKINIRFSADTSISSALIVEKGNNVTGYTIKASTDNYLWKTVYSGTTLGNEVRLPISFAGENCRYVEIAFTSENPVSIYNVELYGYLDTQSEQAKKSIDALTLPTVTSVNLILPSEGEYGGTVTWKSANENIITDSGVITRLSNQDQSTVLTATLTLGDTVVKKSFTVTVSGTLVVEGDSSSGGGGGGGGGSSSGASGLVIPYVGNEANITTGDSSTGDVFKDVTANHWAYSYIYKLKDTGVVSTDSYYRPEDKITREEIVKMLILTTGKEIVKGNNSFSDVDENAWYYPYISTAAQFGVVNGVGNATFGIGQNVSRQDLAVMVYRVLEGMEISAENEAETSYTDISSVASYAHDAVKAMTVFGIMTGFEDGSFAPTANTTRAQCAKIMCVLMDILSKEAN